VRFEDLDFIVMAEGELAQAPIIVQHLHFAGLDVITKVLKELWLRVLEAHAPRSG